MHDLDEVTNLVRDDDEVAYTDAGYQGVDRRPEVTGDEHLSTVEFRVAARKGRLAAMTGPDRAIESRKASVRAKVEHPFLIVKRDFGFTKFFFRIDGFIALGHVTGPGRRPLRAPFCGCRRSHRSGASAGSSACAPPPFAP